MFFSFVAIVAAFFQASKDASAKLIASKVDKYTLAWGITLGIVLFSIPFAIYQGLPDITQLSTQFWLVFALTGLAFALSNTLQSRAIQLSDLSIVIPILNFSPLFTLILSYFILQEIPGPYALVGLFLIIFGAYFLKLDLKDLKSGKWFKPIKAIVTDRGAQLMAIVALIWGADNVLAKIGVIETTASFWNMATRILTLLILTPMMIRASKKWTSELTGNWKPFVVMGFFMATSLFMLNLSLENMNAAIAAALFRFATLFSVIFGALFFKEKNLKERLGGGALMILGVVLITLP
jgi:drug/metabolite transporter (DMT)-like permease